MKHKMINNSFKKQVLMRVSCLYVGLVLACVVKCLVCILRNV